MDILQKPMILVFLFGTILCQAQSEDRPLIPEDTTGIVFKDTLFNIAFDSVAHNLGRIQPVNKQNQLVKYFKYVGTDPVLITRAWSGDPHYICDYPREPLVPNKIYSYTICFWHKGRQGKLNKLMGFNLSDGNTIFLRFTGEYVDVGNKE
ncbi:MAG: hypothetical protein R2792_14385 [Saprospiraceae bacterium]